MALVDCHLHTTFSKDSTLTMDEAVARARTGALAGLVFTEHADFDPRDYSYGYLDYPAARRRARELARAHPDLALGIGVEVSYQGRYDTAIRQFLGAHRFDCLIGSVHFVADQLIRDWTEAAAPTGDYRAYYTELAAVVASGLFDVVGHFDYHRRHIPDGRPVPDPQAYAAETDAILREVVRRELALEVNTSGLRRTMADCFPHRAVLERFRALGGRLVTIGSDSHRATEVGFGFDRAVALLRAVGFTEVFSYRDRAPVAAPLPD